MFAIPRIRPSLPRISPAGGVYIASHLVIPMHRSFAEAYSHDVIYIYQFVCDVPMYNIIEYIIYAMVFFI